MLKTKFSRQFLSFITIALASALLYPVVQSHLTSIIWILLGIIVVANLFTLITD